MAADGASYREILDVADWDRSIATNTPGQSGQAASRYYANLLPMWANGEGLRSFTRVPRWIARRHIDCCCGLDGRL